MPLPPLPPLPLPPRPPLPRPVGWRAFRYSSRNVQLHVVIGEDGFDLERLAGHWVDVLSQKPVLDCGSFVCLSVRG